MADPGFFKLVKRQTNFYTLMSYEVWTSVSNWLKVVTQKMNTYFEGTQFNQSICWMQLSRDINQ